MAAELKKLAHDMEEELRHAEFGHDDLDTIGISQAERINRFINLYWSQSLSREETLSEIKNIYISALEAVSRIEKKNIKNFTERIGIEVLLTDTHGSKTEKAFSETNTPWSTGIPSSGIAVAVMHPDVGIAGSHRNAVTIEDCMKWASIIMDDPSITTRISDFGTRDMVTPDGLVTIVEQATQEALDEFSLISPNKLLPFSKNKILVAGLDFLKENQYGLVSDAVVSVLKRHPALNDNRTLGMERIIGLDFMLGESKGILYGGKNHPNPIYRTPQFFDLR